jgi:WD40 repeat protein
MIVLTGHTDPINQLAFSPDGSTLASAGDDGCLWLWDVLGQCARARISWGAKWIFSVAFSPDGHTLAVGTENSLLLLREDEGQWRPHQQWRDHQTWVTAVAFDRDGQVLASAGADGALRLWDATHRRRHPLLAFPSGLGGIRSLVFAPDGTSFAAGGYSGVGLWRADATEPVIFNRLRDADVRCLAFAPNSQILLAAAGRTILQLDLVNKQAAELLRGHANFFRCLAVAPYGQRAVAGRDDGTVQVWDEVAGADRIYSWHEGIVNSVSVSPDGVTAASAGDDFAICMWEM